MTEDIGLASPRDSRPDAPAQRRSAGRLLIAGPVIFLLAEFIAAMAWTHPAYSYTHHFISNLGVHGPSTLFGQYMYSPLSWVMNAGFFLFGLTILAGVVALRDLAGRGRWATLVPAAMLAVGGVLLALFPGSGEALKDGSGQYHSTGAFLGFIGGNVLAIVLGRRWERIGVSSRMGRALITVGVIGLVSMTAYLGLIVSAGDDAIGIIGLIERGAVHPFLIGLICAGAAINKRRSAGAPPSLPADARAAD
ncbi:MULTISPECIES: DUF998 domain-containing protein [unclassified Streptomyces]|uniref:DUF998 domain-containing protein n=1 Tax=unclassified Streptomyces TaxID=2593676 RepID=UPI00081F62BB|nr:MULTISPECIES: DUF998 domain-containing protein [unclassified Streptomyces]MYR30417.1 DUF998 domain-containing protein [Streptomyces sp. SID4945]SCF49728.1 hypothetical membrane protein [Streptomyces sp. LcepLS]